MKFINNVQIYGKPNLISVNRKQYITNRSTAINTGIVKNITQIKNNNQPTKETYISLVDDDVVGGDGDDLGETIGAEGDTNAHLSSCCDVCVHFERKVVLSGWLMIIIMGLK